MYQIKKTYTGVSGNFSPNGAEGNYFEINVTGNTTLLVPTNMEEGQLFSVRFAVSAVGDVNIDSSGDVRPAISTTINNTVDYLLCFIYQDGLAIQTTGGVYI